MQESGGLRCLILELVQGETLAERIEQGAVPVEESLRLARQIAEALEAAHEKGIVHRDLKPANIGLRILSVLVAGQQIRRVLRRWQAETHRHRD
jgi:serine/threonine protein kinase